MHLTAPGSTCSIAGTWKSIQERYGSSRPFFLARVHVASICSVCGGPMGSSVHVAQRMAVGRQRAERWFAVDADSEQP